MFGRLLAPNPHQIARDLNERMRTIHADLATLERDDVGAEDRAHLERKVARARATYTRRVRRHAGRLTLARTCKTCGHAWHVDPRGAAALQDAARTAVEREGGAGDAPAWTAALEAFHACPTCNATTFDERWAARTPDTGPTP